MLDDMYAYVIYTRLIATCCHIIQNVMPAEDEMETQAGMAIYIHAKQC